MLFGGGGCQSGQFVDDGLVVGDVVGRLMQNGQIWTVVLVVIEITCLDGGCGYQIGGDDFGLVVIIFKIKHKDSGNLNHHYVKLIILKFKY